MNGPVPAPLGWGPVAAGLGWYARRRRAAREMAARRAAAVQEETLLRLVRTARDTEFGLTHGFAHIRSVGAFQERVPVSDYLQFRPLWARAAQGERDVTWPGRPLYWVKTSGTTAGDKMIPVTAEALAMHRRGGWDTFLLAVERAGAGHLLGGPMLFLGSSTTMKPMGAGALVGDLSGLVMRRLPPGIRGRYSPGPAISSIESWETRIEAVAALVVEQDLRLMSGMPSWLVLLFERVARHCRERRRAAPDLSHLWPNLRVLIHGGVAFPPYQSVFAEWVGPRLDRIEVYPASEGFVGLQTEPNGALALMTDYGIFYEFVPVEDLGGERPRRHTVADVELGRPYAVVMSTPAGLWAYVLGDTVRFVARDPLRLVITGRTRHFVNAFGENVIVEEVERALAAASRRTEAEVVEFTVAPRYPSADDARGGHDWLLEFRVLPREPEDFARILDETLAALNADYRTKRAGAVAMTAPRVLELPAGTFYRWLAAEGKLGNQHKVPRVTNDRRIAEGILAAAGAHPGEHHGRLGFESLLTAPPAPAAMPRARPIGEPVPTDSRRLLG
jgi:hypothetical protein